MQDTPQFHARRAALYGYAAAAFQYPDEETLADLFDEEVREAVGDAVATLGERTGADDLADAFRSLEAAIAETDRDAVEPAYNDLFGLPSDEGTYPAVPYEAHYTTGEAVSDEQRRIATVVGLLEQFGLEPAEEFDERQDHLSVELELLQVVAAQRSVALEEERPEAAQRLAEAEATILDEHLVDFVPAFAHEVEAAVGAGVEPAGSNGSQPTEDHDEASDAHAVYAAAASFATTLVEWDDARHPDPRQPDPRDDESWASGEVSAGD